MIILSEYLQPKLAEESVRKRLADVLKKLSSDASTDRKSVV